MNSEQLNSGHIDRTNDRRFFGHPLGLSTLAFTEMWERMSYYGMRGLLVVFMVLAVQEGGFGLTEQSANAIYGLYTGSVYFTGLLGGWIADRLIGGQKAVWYGGIIIMFGHISLAIPGTNTFFLGLILVVLGTGLLKPNIGAMVGQLYKDEDQRRDSGYTIYYLGINIGSAIGGFVCGLMQVKYGYHAAFGAAAVGMGLGLIQYRLTSKNIEAVFDKPTVKMSSKAVTLSWSVIFSLLLVLAIVTVMAMMGSLVIDPLAITGSIATIVFSIFLIYFVVIFLKGKLNPTEKRNVGALFLICIASICFWAGFEQAGSSFNFFAENNTDRMLGDFEIPTQWFQSLNPIFIIVLSPFFAALWVNLGKRMIQPSYSVKCAIGLIIMASGFFVMFFAAMLAADSMKVAPMWLVTTYFLHTVGELCLSPVALSAVSKLSPRRFAGQLMGVFILTYSIGSLAAGLLAGLVNAGEGKVEPSIYLQVGLFGTTAGIILYLISFKSRKWEETAGRE
ncbi:peptide MFS transporter [Glaciecola sp. 1036]|uniref:peptide MFS transporter n=1 Tax=Alteromonadaceae TaxID=72275 RepID=UPI003D00E525